MKNIIKFAILLIVFAGLSTSCGEDYLDVNNDPNNPTSVSPDLVLPVAQLFTANIIQSDRLLNSLGNMMMYNWSQSDGYSWYTDEMKYNVTSSFYDDVFNDTYSTAFKQYLVLDKLGEGYEHYMAISKIMKAYHFQLLVDCYGDVPYTEALGRSLLATPKYDDAKTIYEDLIVQLTDAIAMIKNNDADAQMQNPGMDDAIFNGDMDEWIKFANTIKVRILTRQSDMTGREAYIKDELANIKAEGSGFITADVGVNPGFVVKESGKQNIIWDGLGWDYTGAATMNWRATCATDYVITFLQNTKDPRIDYIYEKPATGHLGVPQGLLDYDTPVIDAYMHEFVSNIGPGILKSGDQDAVIFTLAENFLNLAELREKDLLSSGDDAKTLFEKGVTASFLYLGLEEADAMKYYKQGMALANYEFSANKIEAIITQKWVAVNGITAEQSWFDYTRTGYPEGIPIPLNYSKTPDRPVRLFYPAGEYSSNGKNVPTQPDAFTAKIFWAN